LTPKPAPKRWLITEIPMIEYTEAWDLQVRLVSARKGRGIDKDMVLLLEHPPVFTLGRRGGRENLSVSEDVLKREGISVFQVERGGNITFHGPGQLIVYPIIDLNEARLSVTDYVERLEEVMILVAADWGIRCQRNPLNRGVWVANKKLGSIGIAIRKGISFHGAALNVNLSLRPFSWINPCGLQGIGMTSLEQELGQRLSMDQVCLRVKRHIETVFGIELVPIELPHLITLGHFREPGKATQPIESQCQ
jgi:lipoate-protein ligase B